MRCLHCGVELALLKKLAGGENFCSDAHRAAYHDEFSRLALDRLMQARPASRNKSSAIAAAPAAETMAVTYPTPATTDETIVRKHSDSPPAMVPPASPVLASFLDQINQFPTPRPRPISHEEPIFRFTQHAMPTSTAVIADETALRTSDVFRRPKRIVVNVNPVILLLMDDASIPSPASCPLTAPARLMAPDWNEFPALQFEIKGLECLDWLRTTDRPARETPITPPQNMLPPNRLAGNGGTSAPLPSNLASHKKELSALEPDDLKTLYLAVTSAPSPAQVPMTQEPPPALPDVLHKFRPLKDAGRSNDPGMPQAPDLPPSVPPVTAKSRKAQKSRISAPGPVEGSLGRPADPERIPAAHLKPAKPRQGVPHPAAIMRPGPVEQPSNLSELAFEESIGNGFEIVGEIKSGQGFLQSIPTWAKGLVHGRGAFHSAKLDSAPAAQNRPKPPGVAG